MGSLRRDQQLLLLATGASIILWMVPLLRVGIAPLAYLNTHLHELCHALAGLLTGGSVADIKVFRDFSGVTNVSGGALPIVAAAGYVGASVMGGALIWMGRTPGMARAGLWSLFGLLAVSMVAFVRGDLTGVLMGLLWCGALWAMAAKLSDDSAVFAVQFLGIQQILTSVLAFFALLNVSLGYGHSDAKIMQNATGIPDLVWAGGWMALSLATCAFCLAASWSGNGVKVRARKSVKST